MLFNQLVFQVLFNLFGILTKILRFFIVFVKGCIVLDMDSRA